MTHPTNGAARAIAISMLAQLVSLVGAVLIFYGMASAKLDEVARNTQEIVILKERLSRVEQAIAELPEMRRDIKEILRRVR